MILRQTVTDAIANTVVNHVQQLSHYFSEYVGDERVRVTGFEIRFSSSFGRVNKSYRTLRLDRPRINTVVFLDNTCPLLSESDKAAIICHGLYLCETIFYAVTTMTSKYR